eukprot:1159519-Pelagomonas_calceolata.AAC.3
MYAMQALGMAAQQHLMQLRLRHMLMAWSSWSVRARQLRLAAGWLAPVVCVWTAVAPHFCMELLVQRRGSRTGPAQRGAPCLCADACMPKVMCLHLVIPMTCFKLKATGYSGVHHLKVLCATMSNGAHDFLAAEAIKLCVAMRVYEVGVSDSANS